MPSMLSRVDRWRRLYVASDPRLWCRALRKPGVAESFIRLAESISCSTEAKPHVSARELCSYFGVGQSTASEKDKRIQDSLKIDVFDPRWTLASRLADNPRVWQIMFNGLVVDVREAPREIQEEAVRRGLKPGEHGNECGCRAVLPWTRQTGVVN